MHQLNYPKAEAINLIKKLPAILCYSEENIKEKHQQILDLSIPKEVLLNKPAMLATPKKTLKIRYFILRAFATRDEILNTSLNWFMTNQNKSYARLMHFYSKNKPKIRLQDVLIDEKRLVERHQVTSDELMKRYPLPKEFIYEVQEKFFEEEGITFSAEEKEFIEKEYGE